jgi:glutamate racemase
VNDRPIGVFDSGLGGLTVLQALADLLPDEHLVYLGDTARYPYGPKSREELQRYSLQIAAFLVDQGVKMLVIACNSATAAALELLRDTYDVPVIGVVEPGVRAAQKVTATRHVGVIGTRITADSKIYELTSEALRTGLEMTTLACPGFVELVEGGDTVGPRADAVVRARLEALADHEVDVLVLGCTHYPLLARTIKDHVGRDVTLVSSADETAFEVRDILERTGWTREPAGGPGRRTFFTTGDPTRFRELGERFLGFGLDDVRAHRWDPSEA